MAGNVVLITGVTRGLGLAMAREFIGRGHTVLGCGRTEGKISELRTRFGPPHDFRAVNVASDGEVKVWANSLLKSYSAPDLLLNNAAVINQNACLWEINSEEFSAVIDINIKGVVNVIRHFVPEMIARKRGVIVNFTSGWGRSADAEVAPYCASKWALEGLTLALARELPAGLGAMSLNPGIINTEMLQGCFGKSAGNYQTAAEWAKMAVPFLLKLGPTDNGKQLTVHRDSEG